MTYTMLSALVRDAIIKSLKLPGEFRMVIIEDMLSMGYRFILTKEAKPLAEELFQFLPDTDVSEEIQKIRLWLKPILNPNLKMFSHVKF